MINYKEPQRVLIIDTSYNEKLNLVKWTVQFEDGKKIILAIKGEELSFMLGFNKIFKTYTLYVLV